MAAASLFHIGVKSDPAWRNRRRGLLVTPDRARLRARRFLFTFTGIWGRAPLTAAVANEAMAVLYTPPKSAKRAPLIVAVSGRYPSALELARVQHEPAVGVRKRHEAHHAAASAWVFSAASPMSAPAAGPGASTASKASKGSQMGTVMLRCRGWRRLGVVDGRLAGIGAGQHVPCTWSALKASCAMTATSVESMPPDNPMTTSVKPALRTKAPKASVQASASAGVHRRPPGWRRRSFAARNLER